MNNNIEINLYDTFIGRFFYDYLETMKNSDIDYVYKSGRIISQYRLYRINHMYSQYPFEPYCPNTKIKGIECKCCDFPTRDYFGDDACIDVISMKNMYSDSEDKTCVFCLEDFDEHSFSVLSECNHLFHTKCFKEYQKNICDELNSGGRKPTFDEEENGFLKCPKCRQLNNSIMTIVNPWTSINSLLLEDYNGAYKRDKIFIIVNDLVNDNVNY